MTKRGKEIEAKFLLRHLAQLRKQILAAGGLQVSPRVLERNLRFDKPDGSLSATNQVLRLRQDVRTVLTYKRSLSAEEREEIEIEVDDFNTAQALLETLGYQVIFTYEKYREVFSVNPVLIMLDDLPFGAFVEIEGPSIEDIRQAAEALDLDWERRSRQDYLALFGSLSERLQLPFRDATFANFVEGTSIHPGDLGLAYASRSASPTKENP
jgi:adenylate cyclase class 2